LLLAQVAALLLSTGVVFIDAGEQGLLERFGKPVEGRLVLGPGAHLKFPGPSTKSIAPAPSRFKVSMSLHS